MPESLDALLLSYELDLEDVVARVRAFKAEHGAETVGIQLPDGLRDYATLIAQKVESEADVLVVINADPSFGACDIALNLDRHIDLLVHFGHTEMPSILNLYDMQVLFIPARHRASVAEVAVKAAKLLPGTRVGIVTTAQHGHKLAEAVGALKDAGFDPVVGFGDNRLEGAGQLLGCNFTAGTSIEADVDGFVYLGSGDFHPIAMRFGTKKPVILGDPYTNEVRTIDDVMDRFMRQRFAAIERAKGAEEFGLLVGLKVGQERMKLAKGLKKMLEQKGKKAHIIALDFFSWDNLQYFRHLGALVNTGCPRITTDDYSRYPMPMLTPPELEVILGKRTWEQYAFDEFKGTKPAPKGDGRFLQIGG